MHCATSLCTLLANEPSPQAAHETPRSVIFVAANTGLTHVLPARSRGRSSWTKLCISLRGRHILLPCSKPGRPLRTENPCMPALKFCQHHEPCPLCLQDRGPCGPGVPCSLAKVSAAVQPWLRHRKASQHGINGETGIAATLSKPLLRANCDRRKPCSRQQPFSK